MDARHGEPANGGYLHVFANGGARTFAPDASPVSVGRSAGCDVRVPAAQVSRIHGWISFTDGIWAYRDNGSSYGTLHGDDRLSQPLGLTADRVELSLGLDGPVLQLWADDREALPATESAPSPINVRSHRLPSSGGMVVGRGGDADLRLNDLLVSRHHCQITPQGDQWQVGDLGSTLGTYINGTSRTVALIDEGDTLTVGATTFQVHGGSLVPVRALPAVGFEAQSLTVVTDSGTTILNDVSFSVPTKALVAVVGPSGAGKSTLLNALTGMRPATRGGVQVYGADLYRNYEQMRRQIGLVPQQDLIHTQLTTRTALHYAGQLRFGMDVSPEELDQRVDEVLDQLELDQRAELRIDRLSGGQRKRASVALELLTRPTLLFLDEPTSGLDPGLDRTVMELLRSLADEDRIVFVVTHSVANLDVCDYLLVMAEGGTCAYFGPPMDAPAAFGVDGFAEMFRRLGREHAEERPVPMRLTAARVEHRQLPNPSPRPVWRQFLTLTGRYGKVIASDRSLLVLLLCLPFLLGALGLVVGTPAGLSGSNQPYTPGRPVNTGASVLLLILVLGTTFMGIASAIQEIVKERVIYERERSVGLPPGAYLASKFLLLSVISIYQTTVFFAVTMIGRSFGDEALTNDIIDILLPCLALGIASVALGLMLSAALRSQDQAMPLLVLATMILIVLSGALTLRFDGLLEWAQYAVPSFWAHNAMAAAVDLNALTGAVEANETWEHTMENWTAGVLGTLAFAPAFLAAASVALRRR